MSASLTCLPVELLEQVFGFLDDKSLLELRKVCKIAKSESDVIVLFTVTPEFISLTLIKEKNNGDAMLKFAFDKVKSDNRDQCKRVLVAAVNHLRINSFLEESEAIITTANVKDTTDVFNRFTPLMRKATFKTLNFHSPHWPSTEISWPIIKFFDGKVVSQLSFKLDGSAISRNLFWILIDRLEPRHVQLEIEYTVPSADFLKELAGKVDEINILASDEHWTGDFMLTTGTNAHSNMNNFVTTIPKSRCSYLDLSGACINMTLSDALTLRSSLDLQLRGKLYYFAANTYDKTAYFYNTSEIVNVAEIGAGTGLNRVEVRRKEVARREW